MLAIISLLLIVALSLIVTRTAAVALTYTGLSQQAASFQARSAFTGVGYTTSEAESLVNHPVRRQGVWRLRLAILVLYAKVRPTAATQESLRPAGTINAP